MTGQTDIKMKRDGREAAPGVGTASSGLRAVFVGLA